MSERYQHRGLDAEINKGLPNSFESFRERYRQNVELDVSLLSDGNIAVLHAKDLGLSQEEIEAISLSEIEKISIPDRAGRDSGLVPTFEEYAFNCLDRGNGLMIEIKASTPDKAQELARKIVQRISKMSREDKTFSEHPEYLQEMGLHSFSIEALEAAKQASAELKTDLARGLLWSSKPENAASSNLFASVIERSGYKPGDDWTKKGIELAASLGVESIDLHDSVVDQSMVQYAHEKGLKVFVWVVNDPARAEQLEDMGVDKIITEI